MLGLSDEPLLEYLFDDAVSWFGHWVESKLEEHKKVRRGKQWVQVPRYRLGQLLGTEQPHLLSAAEARALFGG